MHTIVETPVFMRSAKDARVTEAELDHIKDFLAHNPTAGDEMPGTGGARKVRFAARGKGKSGGYRVITFYSGEDIPVFLLDVYAKGEKIDLTQDEKNILRNILREIVETYRRTSS
ncbi:MAG: type II toxin-antitoxin system RelE/ParE family toxin [Anaerolineae bacterium]|nr:type II toxin-antitoxin system RelE/ParE family toxin [Anaerolineae bacterium]